MFDIGFSELMIIAVVALVVIGPERLPGVARTAGALFGRAQRYVNELKADIQSEVDLEEFDRIKSTFYDAAKSVEHSVNQAKEELDATVESLNANIAATPEAPAAAAVDTAPALARKPLAPLSITARLALLYAVSACVMLLATTAFLYWVLVHCIERADFYFVVDKAQRLEWALQHHADDFSFLDREVKWEGGPHELDHSHTFYSRIRRASPRN